jgi:hypothetical protein
MAGGVANITLFVPPADPPLTNRVKLYLDTAAVPGWNEIDAVELVDAEGNAQWASGSTASSAWNRPAATTSSPPPESLVPKFGTLGRPTRALVRPTATQETRCVVGFGWPMTVIYGEAELAPTAGAPGSAAGVLPAGGAGGASAVTWGLSPSGGSSGTLVLTGAGGQPSSAGYVTYASPTGPMFVTGATPPPTPAAVPAGVGPGGTTPLPKPRRIYWTGLLVNTLLFATLIAAGRFILLAPGRFVREVSRLRSGRCIACGYDLGYDFAKGCPECGWRRPTRDRIPLTAEPKAPPEDVRAA